MKKIALVADDYTGAGDAAIPFVEAGVAMDLVIPATDPAEALAAEVGGVAVDSETRFLGAKEAAKRVGAVFAACRAGGYDLFYKKTDSVLRGNPGAETEAALAATGRKAALFCSAIPGMGRTCRGGMMFLKGVPLAESEIGRDQFTPLKSSLVAEILGDQTSIPAGALDLQYVGKPLENTLQAVDALLADGVRIIIADAETDADLARLADVLLARADLLPAGASGLSRMLAKALGGAGASPAAYQPMRGRMLAVIGSLTSTAREQADCAEAAGGFGRAVLNTAAAAADAGKEVERLCALGDADKHLILTTDAKDSVFDKESGLRVAALLGQTVRGLLDNCGYDIIYSTGGSTSVAIAGALGLDRIRLQREPLPGVVQGVFPRGGRERWFVSKAGGFGGKETMRDLLQFIKED